MDEKDLKRLRRQDLLEMLLERTREVEDLRAQNASLSNQVSELQERLHGSASLQEREAQLQESIRHLDEMLGAHERELGAILGQATGVQSDLSKIEALVDRADEVMSDATELERIVKQAKKASSEVVTEPGSRQVPDEAPMPMASKLAAVVKVPMPKKRKKKKQ